MAGLLKVKQLLWKDSNIAGLGSAEDKAQRERAAKMEAEWAGAGKKVGVEVWHVEKLKVKRQDAKQNGTFYSGDSYIVLQTYQKPGSPALLWNIFFWLGKYTSQDEAGVAAYKTVELDDLLGGSPVEFREVQGYESTEFLSQFPHMRVLDGGVESGFSHVTPEKYVAKLLHVKGKTEKTVALHEVPCKCDSLNEGDAFILDNGLEVVVWHGKEAAVMEKRKAEEAARVILEERLGKAKVRYIASEDDDAAFYKVLGGKTKIKSAAEGGVDDSMPVLKVPKKHLAKLSDASGKLTVTAIEAKGGKYTRANFDSNDVFIFDLGDHVYVWVGKGASKAEKKNAMPYAVQYLKQSNLPLVTPITRILEGGETERFGKDLLQTIHPGTRCPLFGTAGLTLGT